MVEARMGRLRAAPVLLLLERGHGVLAADRQDERSPVMAEKGSVRSLGPIQWLSILILALIPALFFAFSWRPSLDPAPFGTTILGPAGVGPWSVVVGGPAPLPRFYLFWRAAGGFSNSLSGGRVTLPVGHSPNEPYERLDLALQHACALANAMKQSLHIRQAQAGDRPVVRGKQ